MTVALPFVPDAWYNSSLGQLAYKYDGGTLTSTVAISGNNWTTNSSSTVNLSGTFDPYAPLSTCLLEESGTIYNCRYYSGGGAFFVERSFDGINWSTFYTELTHPHTFNWFFKVASTYYLLDINAYYSGGYYRLSSYALTTSSLSSAWSTASAGSFDTTQTYYSNTSEIRVYWFSGYFYIFPSQYLTSAVPLGKGKAIHQSTDGVNWTVTTSNFSPLASNGDKLKSVFFYNGKFYATVHTVASGYLKTYSSPDLVIWTYMPTLTEKYLVIGDTFNIYQYSTDACCVAGSKVLHLPLSALGAAAPTSIAL